MAIDSQDEALLARIYRNLKEQPIEPGHPFYVTIWEDSPHDPVRRLRKHIQWSEVESLQLFSGFSGSGKTTQLQRLKQELESAGYRVIYANAEDYLNLGEAVDITDLLITVTGAFSDKLDPELVRESYWDRLVNYLVTTKVEISGATFKFNAAELKAEIHTSPTFRRQLQNALNTRLPQIAAQVRKFVEEVAQKVAPTGFNLVFLFDSFEKLRGTPSNEQEIMSSVERLFRNHLDLLRLPYIHCVYSVPAWLPYAINYEEVVVIPSMRLWHQRKPGQSDADPDEQGFDKVREILHRRFTGHEACSRVFGQPHTNGRFPSAERLLEASGGTLRDLLRLFREVLLQARDLPVSPGLIDAAIANVPNDFRISVEDAHWLAKIHQEQDAVPKTSTAPDVNRLMRLLDSHLVLYYRNDENWFDSHPLVREEVKRILALNPDPQKSA